MIGFLRPLVAIGLALAIWQGIIIAFEPPRFIFPSPSRVAETWWENRMLIAWHTGVTMSEVALGLIIGVTVGCITALTLATSGFARLALKPILVFSQALPVFALAPILVLWLGYGMGSKIAMATLIIYFPVTSAFYDGLMRTPPGMLDLARVMGASPRRILWVVRVPAAIPSFVSGLRLAAVYAPIGAVIGEWVGASNGLGYLMLLANGRAKTDLMFAAMITLGVCSVILYLTTLAATNRIAPETQSKRL